MNRNRRDRPQRRDHCAAGGHKVSYRTQLDAEIVLSKRRRQDKGEVRSYQCPNCDQWHLTSWAADDEPSILLKGLDEECGGRAR